MKNLMIAAVLSLGTMTAFAQETETSIEETENAVEETATDAAEATEEAAEDTYGAAEEGVEEAGDAVEETYNDAEEGVENAAEETEAATENAAEETAEYAEEKTDDAEEAMSQDGFSEVAIEEVPEAITTALEEAHPGATVDKAHMNEQSQYKLEVTKEDGETAELYMDAEGNMIEM
ncbi:MAG: hypothetical protein WA913_01350 [Pricia sp.]